MQLLENTSLYQVDDSPYLHSFEDNETDVTFSWDVDERDKSFVLHMLYFSSKL